MCLATATKHSGIAGGETVIQLLEYQEGGVYGEYAKEKDVPMVAH
jgi:hypothetical protein